MPTDNLVLLPGGGGATVSTLSDSGGVEWPACVVTYATTISPGANVLQEVTPAHGLPVAQQGNWSVGQAGTWTTAVTQGTAANLNATVVGTGTFAVQASQAGTWSVRNLDGSGNGLTSLSVGTQRAITVAIVDASGNQVTSFAGGGGGGASSNFAAAFPAAGTAVGAIDSTGTNMVPLNLDASGNLKVLAVPSGTYTVAGTVAVTGTFWQATQPVSGTFWQAVQPVSGTFWQATQPVSGTFWQATQPVSMAAGLAAGTNLIGQVSASGETGTIYNGTTAIVPQFAAINASSSGTNTVVTGTAGKRIRVVGWSLVSTGTVNVKWQDSTPTDLTGTRPMVANATAGRAYCPVGVMQTAVGKDLVLNLSAAVAVGGELTYILV